MIYEFYCKKCQKPFEVSQRMKNYDPRLVHCPFCQAQAKDIQRRYHPHAVFFHGQGFYVNDNSAHNSASERSDK